MKTDTRHTGIAERFEALRPRLRAWASRVLGNEADADDALQEAFFRLWRRGDGDTLSTTMSYTAVRCACIDLLRRRSVRQSEPIEAADNAAVVTEAEAAAEMMEDVRALIDSRLDSRQREVLMLHDTQGYDYSEIASMLGITEPNARVILSRARKIIREAYREQDNG